MEKQKIVITVGEDGSLVGDVVGGKGIDCVNKLDELLKDLANVVETERKPDFFNQGQNQTNNIHVENYR